MVLHEYGVQSMIFVTFELLLATFQLHVNRSNELLTLHYVVNEISPLFVNRFRRSKVVVCGKISPLHDDTTG